MVEAPSAVPSPLTLLPRMSWSVEDAVFCHTTRKLVPFHATSGSRFLVPGVDTSTAAPTELRSALISEVWIRVLAVGATSDCQATR